MSTVEDYFQELEELCSEVEKEMTASRKSKGKERESKALVIKNRLQRAKVVLRSVKVEFREMSKLEALPFQDRAREYEERVKKLLEDVGWMERDEEHREELLQKAEEDNDYKKILEKGAAIQTDDLQRLENMRRQVDETIVVGTDILTEMSEQKDQLNQVRKGVDEVEANVKIASKQARILARRLATDKIILGFILLIVILVVFIIIYSVVKPKDSLIGGSSSLSPLSVTTIIIPVVTTFLLGYQALQ